MAKLVPFLEVYNVGEVIERGKPHPEGHDDIRKGKIYINPEEVIVATDVALSDPTDSRDFSRYSVIRLRHIDTSVVVLGRVEDVVKKLTT